MSKEPFMLVSLKEDKAKKLAQVMSNPTCIRILDYLANKEGTESEIAKDLKIPLSTVHYNLQQLAEAKLVVVEEFHYSKKGREVNHYKLANKYIIIAPQEEDESFVERLRQFLPVAILTIGVAATLKLLQMFTGTLPPSPDSSASVFSDGMDAIASPMAVEAVEDSSRMMKAEIADEGMGVLADEGVGVLAEDVADSSLLQMATTSESDMLATAPTEIVEPTSLHWWQSPMVDWFILGALSVLVIILLWEMIRYWRSRK